MAEGIQLASFNTKYFCHHCSREVSPFHTAELICPDCSSGFLEEVSKDLYNVDTYSCPDEDDDSDLEDVSNLSFLPNTMDNFFSRVLMNVGEDLPEEEDDVDTPRRRLFRADSFSDVMRHISMRELLSADEEDSPFVSFRYFDDYTGDEEIDALASQLLDEVEISGPPPLAKDQIKSLPSLAVTTDLLEKGMQCTVCMDDFRLRDKAKRLPCNHLYHEKCITPWLERQATCPNCREIVQVQPKSKRSRSCPRTRLNTRNGDNRRFSEASTLNDFFTSSINPFRFYN
ncbi:E3 ubiquitin-protein ligase RNF126-A-like isoform X2 [Argiope bruennichi]|uniref:RING-type E3 ubiquitin transferase n=1 Tax=Argiope bruennichi TaxID=94029 RepID=A0A8T0EQN4_ARGBR|nr:E3 ubiquitin-protein ligase RNF126-A-like isoform X2 [Argiope bruennichi]KAF8777594.1 E3 ubiquitin-protein ligase RNF126 like protein [Argiope bruennichi]